jgi:hypothetical protein
MKTFWNLHSQISLWKKLVKNDHTWARVVVVDNELWWQYEILKGNISEEKHHNMENKLEKSFSSSFQTSFVWNYMHYFICSKYRIPQFWSYDEMTLPMLVDVYILKRQLEK